MGLFGRFVGQNKKCESFVKIMCSNCEKAGYTPKNRGFVGQNGERCAHLLNTGGLPQNHKILCWGTPLFFEGVHTTPGETGGGIDTKKGVCYDVSNNVKRPTVQTSGAYCWNF